MRRNAHKYNDEDIALRVTNVNKSFGGVRVLKDVSFEVRKGEVHGLVGENGAGKSVLMKTLMGVHQPDSGEYVVADKKVRFANPAAAQRNRVSMVYQEFGLVQFLSVTENIFMGRLPSKSGIVQWRSAKNRVTELLDKLGSNVSPDAIIGDLRVAEQQEVEIARALSYDPLVFIMDEPTSALSYDEVGHLYDLVNFLRNKGVAIVYISHKLDEVFHLVDRVTIIRDGNIVGTHGINDLDVSTLVEKMTGKKVSAEIHREDIYTKPKENVIELQDFTAERLFFGVNLTVGKGEIVGLAGLIGAGKTELCKAIFGALPKTVSLHGRYLFDSKNVDRRSLYPSKAKKMGIGFVTEDRQAEGIIQDQSVLFNIVLTAYHRITKGFVKVGGLAQNLVRGIIKDVSIRPPEPATLMRFLSGGNQQKVVIGKWLAADIKLLILDEPTRGVDVGAREEIYNVIREHAKRGLGVLLCSSDLREIMLASDRIVVMRLGGIVGELLPYQTSEQQLLQLVLGKEVTSPQ